MSSWALVAHSAITLGGASGILAASSDIEAVITSGSIAEVFVFPDEKEPAGIYLWEGVADTDEWDYTGASRRLDLAEVQGWIDRNGEAP